MMYYINTRRNGGLYTYCTRVCTVLLKQVVRTLDYIIF